MIRTAVTVLGSTAAALALGLAFDSATVRWFAPLAVGAVLVGWSRARSWRGALTGGLSFGLAFWSTHLWWVIASTGPLAWGALVTWGAAGTAITALLARATGARRGSTLVLAATWWGVEAARSSWPLGGLPWGRLGTTALDTPWSGLLAFAGVGGTSLLLAWAGVVVTRRPVTWLARATDVRRPRSEGVHHTAGRVAVTLCLASLLVAGSTTDPGPSTETARVAIVQGDVPGDGTRVLEHREAILASHLALTQALSEELRASDQPLLDLVVWPESSLPADPLVDPAVRAAVEASVVATGDAPLLIAAIAEGPTAGTALNQSLLWGRDGPGGRYTKAHPVPFGEYIPWRDRLAWISPRLDEIPRDMLAGAEAPKPLPAGSLDLAVGICFDVAYADTIGAQVRAGADLVVVQTSNAAFTGTSQPEQQFLISRARAVETGRDMVVSSVNGVSGLIAADGSVRSRLPVTTPAARVVEARLYDTTTPGVRVARFSDVVGVLALTLLLVRLALSSLLRRRDTAVETPADRSRAAGA